MANHLLKKITTVEETYSVEEDPAKVEGLGDTDRALEGTDPADENVDQGEAEPEVTAKPAKSPRAVSGTRPHSSKC